MLIINIIHFIQVLQRDEPCSFEFLPWYQSTIRINSCLRIEKNQNQNKTLCSRSVRITQYTFPRNVTTVLISAYLFPSYSFRMEIDYTYLIQGETAIMEWAEERLEFNNEFEIAQSPSSQLMECENLVDDSQDIDNDEDNYVGLSLEEMMESCPRKKIKIVNKLTMKNP